MNAQSRPAPSTTTGRLLWIAVTGVWAHRLQIVPLLLGAPAGIAVHHLVIQLAPRSGSESILLGIIAWTATATVAGQMWLSRSRQHQAGLLHLAWQTRRRWPSATHLAGLANRHGELPRLRRLVVDTSSIRGVVNLPAGVSPADLLDVADRLAVGLRASAVSIHPDPADASRVELTITFGQPLQHTVAWDVSPMTDDHIAIGLQADGRIAHVSLLGRSLLVGGSTGAGKSGLIQLIVATTVATPSWQVAVIDPKRVELSMWRHHVEHHATTIEDAITVLDKLLAEMERRYVAMEAGGRRTVDRNDRTTPPVLLVVDELAELTATADKKAAAVIEDRLRRYLSLGRAAGMSALLATQRPSHDVVPTSVRDLVPQRIALSCTTSAQSDTILGAGWATDGHDASRLPKDQPGTGLLLTGNHPPVLVRTGYVDDTTLRHLSSGDDR